MFFLHLPDYNLRPRRMAGVPVRGAQGMTNWDAEKQVSSKKNCVWSVQIHGCSQAACLNFCPMMNQSPVVQNVEREERQQESPEETPVLQLHHQAWKLMRWTTNLPQTLSCDGTTRWACHSGYSDDPTTNLISHGRCLCGRKRGYSTFWKCCQRIDSGHWWESVCSCGIWSPISKISVSIWGCKRSPTRILWQICTKFQHIITVATAAEPHVWNHLKLLITSCLKISEVCWRKCWHWDSLLKHTFQSWAISLPGILPRFQPRQWVRPSTTFHLPWSQWHPSLGPCCCGTLTVHLKDSSLRGLWHTKVWLAAMYSPKQELLSTSAWQFDSLLSMKSRCLSLHYCLRHQWSSIPIARMPQRLQRTRAQKRPSYNLFFEPK